MSRRRSCASTFRATSVEFLLRRLNHPRLIHFFESLIAHAAGPCRAETWFAKARVVQPGLIFGSNGHPSRRFLSTAPLAYLP